MAEDKTQLVREVLRLNIKRAVSAMGFPENWETIEALERSGNLLQGVNSSIKQNQVFRKRDFQSIFQFSAYRNFLYYLVRTLKPATVVETGVFHGLTSAWILKALNDNNKGKLISIDLPRRDWKKYFPEQNFGPGAEGEDELPVDELPGWAIPTELRHRWELLLGPSSLHLEKVLAENNVELFIHDSDHSYDVMKYECELVFGMQPKATVVIDDFDLNTYLFEALQNRSLDHCFMDDVTDQLGISQCFAICKQKTK